MIYEPKLKSQPHFGEIREAENIEYLIYRENPDGLYALKKEFFNNGRRDLERKITFAIEKSNTNIKLKSNNLFKLIEGGMRFFFFGITSDYGMRYWRPINIILLIIVIGMIPYSFAVRGFGNAQVWHDSVESVAGIRNLSGRTPRLVTVKKSGKFLRPIEYIFRSLQICVYSSFHFGWGDVNISNWLTRIQFSDYGVRLEGWPRTVAGVQSITCLYLLVIWGLAYFGRPFG